MHDDDATEGTEERCPHCEHVWLTFARQGICPACMKPWVSAVRVSPMGRLAVDAVRFRARRPARTRRCARCSRRRAATWHHWTSQGVLRGYVGTLGLASHEAARELAALLRDERNLTPLCGACHLEGEAKAGSRRFVWEEVPASAIEFARELGEMYVARLRRVYPTCRRDDDGEERSSATGGG